MKSICASIAKNFFIGIGIAGVAGTALTAAIIAAGGPFAPIIAALPFGASGITYGAAAAISATVAIGSFGIAATISSVQNSAKNPTQPQQPSYQNQTPSSMAISQPHIAQQTSMEPVQSKQQQPWSARTSSTIDQAKNNDSKELSNVERLLDEKLFNLAEKSR